MTDVGGFTCWLEFTTEAVSDVATYWTASVLPLWAQNKSKSWADKRLRLRRCYCQSFTFRFDSLSWSIHNLFGITLCSITHKQNHKILPSLITAYRSNIVPRTWSWDCSARIQTHITDLAHSRPNSASAAVHATTRTSDQVLTSPL